MVVSISRPRWGRRPVCEGHADARHPHRADSDTTRDRQAGNNPEGFHLVVSVRRLGVLVQSIIVGELVNSLQLT